ncbi:hypothetical protein GALL_323560 [mine drainage metagenome]|uniref:Uncharacterized protein n=1 Tax=mine drainage metagenome TaxID=410659 RepID=A0A1J5R154_9ZZZZ
MAENVSKDDHGVEPSEEQELKVDGVVEDETAGTESVNGNDADDDTPSPYEEATMPCYTEDDPIIRNLNMKLCGLLTLHYPARDVKLIVDGDAALRILSMFHQRSDKRWTDHLDPRWSSAASGWVVLDLGEPLAMSYMPMSEPRERTVVDPQVAA